MRYVESSGTRMVSASWPWERSAGSRAVSTSFRYAPTAGPRACSTRSRSVIPARQGRSEEHTSELQSRLHLVCRLLLEKKKHKHSDIGIANMDLPGENFAGINLTGAVFTSSG